MSRNSYNGRELSVRLTGYVADAEKNWWDHEFNRVAALEGLRNASMGTLFSRICKSELRLDLASLSKYRETHKPEKKQKTDHPKKRKINKSKQQAIKKSRQKQAIHEREREQTTARM